MTQYDDDPRLLRISDADNICVVSRTIEAGETLRVGGTEVTLAKKLPLGHKLAVRAIAAGETVRKYDAPIGSATAAIAIGEHVHTHNLQSDYIMTFERDGDEAFDG
jgi:altronate dehydratase